MDMHQNQAQLQEALDRILHDEYFKKSSRSVHLLNFLFEKATQGQDVNEIMVGEELFKSNYNYENSDSKVRVYMHYLRKKLDEYYFKNKVNTSIKFEVKKGQYNLSYIEIKNEKHTLTINSSTTKFNVRYIAFALIIGVAIGLLVNTKNVLIDNNYCWDVFFNSNSENLCIISDHFVFSHNHSSGKLASVHPAINTQEEFISYLQHNSETNFELADYSFLTKMAPIAVKTLSNWFIKNNNDFSLRFEEDVKINELSDKNFIFIGSYRIMGNVKTIFLSNSNKFSLSELRSEFISLDNGIKTVHETQYPNIGIEAKMEKQLFTEYAMVSFMTMEKGNKGLFFTSNHDIGVMATTSRFTDKTWLKNFYKSNNINENAQFNALFEVSGLERSELSCKLVDVELIAN